MQNYEKTSNYTNSFAIFLCKPLLIVLFVAVAGAVETVRAHLFLRQSNALYQVFDGGELQTGQSQSAGNLLHHALILRCACRSVFRQVFLVVALEITYDASRDEFQVAL